MAPIVAIVNKATVDQLLGIGLINATGGSSVTISISSLAEDGLFVGSGLRVGQQVLSINNIDCHGMTSGDAVRILRNSVGQITVIADDPAQTATVVAATAPRTSWENSPRWPSYAVRDDERRTGYVILKKTWRKIRTAFRTEKYFSFHGPMSQDDVDTVNSMLRQLRLGDGASCLQFDLDDFGHFTGKMNREAQEHHEEDFTVVILEVMQQLGWSFRFQYEADESLSQRFTGQTGDSRTPPKELFIFHRTQS